MIYFIVYQKPMRNRNGRERRSVGRREDLQKWGEERHLARVRTMRDWEITELYLNNNKRRQILIDIEHISFPKLTHLTLCNNNIVSFEILSRISMPMLKNLKISANKGRQVATIRKGHWPQLFKFQFYDNKIIDGEKLTEGCFSKLKSMWLDSTRTRRQIDDIRFLIKLQSCSLTQILIERKRLASQPYIENIVAKKWPQSNS